MNSPAGTRCFYNPLNKLHWSQYLYYSCSLSGVFIPSVGDAVNSRIRHLITVKLDVILGYLRMIIHTLDNEGKMAASTHGNARLKRQRSLVSFTSGGGLLQTKVLKRGETTWKDPRSRVSYQ